MTDSFELHFSLGGYRCAADRRNGGPSPGVDQHLILMSPYHQQVSRRQRIVLKHDPVQHFVLQVLPDLLVGRRIHKVLQFIWVRSQVKELFSLVATRRHRIAAVFGSQGLLPGMLDNSVTIRTLAQQPNDSEKADVLQSNTSSPLHRDIRERPANRGIPAPILCLTNVRG